jgi:alkaline phosphatase
VPISKYFGYFPNEATLTNPFCAAVDVNIYASSPDDARLLIGNHENTDVGAFIADYLSLDLDSVTRELKRTSYSAAGTDGESSKYAWMGKALGDDVVVDKLDSYHGDFRRVKRWDVGTEDVISEVARRQNIAGRSCGCDLH